MRSLKIAVVVFIVAVLVVAWSVVVIVPPGYVGVVVMLGKVDQQPVRPR